MSRRFISLLILWICAAQAWAGGPFQVNGVGEPLIWDDGSPILYQPDQGPLGQLSNAGARALLAEAFQVWEDVGVVSFTEGLALPEDVDGTNFLRYVFCTAGQPCRTDGLSPIVFDSDGSIIDGMLGPGARFVVFGLGGIQTDVAEDPTITEAAIVINGAFFDGIGPPDSPADLGAEAFKAVLVHEIGHFLNLDHSALNGELAGDGDPDNDVYLPTMYPISSDDDAALATLNPDDEAALRTIYWGGGVPQILGRVQVESPGLPETLYFQGASVVLRKTDDPLMTAYSTVSGALFFPCEPGGVCYPCSGPCTANPTARGEFGVEFIEPGNYTVCVEQLDTRLQVGPRDLDGDGEVDDARAIVPGPEECYDLAESPLAAADDPDQAALVSAASMPDLVLRLNDLPLADPFEPNNTRATASALPGLPSGHDTVGAVLGAGDLDHYAIPVLAGDRLRVDVDAWEIGYLQGQGFDPVLGLYDPGGALVAIGSDFFVDDATDPDSAQSSLDPAFEITVGFTGTATLVVSSHPDLDLDGVGGNTTGPYWLRVVVDRDADGDGTVDRLDRCPADALDDADDDGVCESVDTCPGDSDPDGDGVPGPCIAEPGWILTRTIPFAFPIGARYNPIDGKIYVGRRGSPQYAGLYRIESDGSAVFQWDSATNVASLLVDPTDGDLFATADSSGEILRSDFGNPGPDAGLWVEGFGTGDEDPVGMAIAPAGYSGSVLAPGEALVVDRDEGSVANGQLWVWSPDVAEGEALAYDDDVLVDVVDVAIDEETVWLVDTREGAAGAIYGLDSGTLTPLATSQPIQEPSAITIDPDSGDLLVLDSGANGGGRRVLRVDPATGQVDAMLTQLELSAAEEWAGLDVSPLGSKLIVTDRAAERIYVFERDRDGDGVTDDADSCTGDADPLQGDADGDGFGDACDSCPFTANPGQRVRIDTGLATPGEVVGSPLISPDGSRIVFRAESTPGVFELYSAPSDGGSPVKLNGTLVAGGDVSSMVLVSPDGSRVIYRADQQTDEVVELYSVPIAGGTPVKLNGTLVAGGDVSSGPSTVLVSPDGTRVIYLADQNADEVVELYSVPIAGGTPVKLNGALGSGGDVSSVTVGASHAVFVADATDGVFELYSVPIAGGTPVKLNGPLAPGGSVFIPLVSPNGMWVVYTADQSTAGVVELYSVPITGGTPVKLNGALVSGGDVSLSNPFPAISPDGGRVVYHADQDTDEIHELYSVSLFGGTSVKLNGTLQDDGADIRFLISGADYRVVYAAQQDTAGVVELYSVPPTGGTPVKLNGPLMSGGDVSSWSIFVVSVIYSADQEADGVDELYSVPLDGGLPIKLSGALASGERVASHAIAYSQIGPSHVVYTVARNAGENEVFELFAVPALGGEVLKVNVALLPGASVENFSVSMANGSGVVVYVADEEADDVLREIHRVVLDGDRDADGAADACDRCPFVSDVDQADGDGDGFGDACDVCPRVEEQVHLGGGGMFNSEAEAEDLALSPDGETGVFVTSMGSAQLFSVPTSGGAAVQLNGGGGVSAFRIAPDGSQVLFVADQDTGQVFELYRVALAGGAPVKLSGALVPGGDVVSISGISPDGSRVVYRADANTNDVFELYSVPLSGGSTVKLNGLLPPGGDVLSAAIAADSSRVVYHANQDTALVSELYSVPLAGGTPVKLNGTLVASGHVLMFLISPDSSRVVYGADQDTNDVVELYSVPLTGGATVKLNGALVPGGDVSFTLSGVAIAPNGSRVVYQADQDTNDVVELYSVPLVGGFSIKLNATLVAGGQVLRHSIAPNSSRVVYGADQDTSQVFELYSVPLAGGTVVKLNGALALGDDVSDHAIAPDSSHVVYRILDLYRVPLAGGIPTRLTSGGVGPFVLSADHSRAIYFINGDPESELFSARLGDDVDADAILGFCDVCPGASDPAQSDADGDGVGDACDNCPAVPNPTQAPCPPDTTSPTVLGVKPVDGFLDAALSTRVLLLMSERIDPASATTTSFFVETGGLKVPGSVSVGASGTWLEFDPHDLLEPDADYTVRLTHDLVDLAGNPAIPFTSVFDTVGGTGLGGLPADLVGKQLPGAPIRGRNPGDHAGFSVAALGDVNADGTADLLIGAPDAEPGGLGGAGSAMLVFGERGLQSDAAAAQVLEYLGQEAGQAAGWVVARAGDLNGDGRADLLIGAPFSDPNGNDSGQVYVVFGDDGLDELAGGALELEDLASCAADTLCGVVFEGAATGDRAGAAISFAGDLNGDLQDDLLIGAPGASPDGRTGAGKVYLVYGPLTAGQIDLDTVGSTTPGLVFHGEEPGDSAGAALSAWIDTGVGGTDGHDDFLIGAPGAGVVDPWNSVISEAGIVYAVRGGTANLEGKALADVIELSRTPADVLGFVFLGTLASGRVGSSLTGGIDSDADGQPDIYIGGENRVLFVSGGGPKTVTGNSSVSQQGGVDVTRRQLGQGLVLAELGGVFYVPGLDGSPGLLVVGPGGDVNDDGVDDVVIGAAGADPPGPGADAGKAYIVYGSAVRGAPEVLLSDVGGDVPGLALEGRDPSDALGRSVGGGFDVNGDGIDDALVGAPFADPLEVAPEDARGESYVVSPVAPDEVDLVLVARSGSTARLEWTVPDRALGYNVYRGLLAAVRAAGEVRTSDVVPAFACDLDRDGEVAGLPPEASDAATPAAGTAFVYLVTARNLIGEGPLGPPGDPRTNDGQCP